MANIAISEIETEASSISDNDLLLISKASNSGNGTYTSAKLKYSNFNKKLMLDTSNSNCIEYATNHTDPNKLLVFNEIATAINVATVTVPFDSIVTFDMWFPPLLENKTLGIINVYLTYTDPLYQSPTTGNPVYDEGLWRNYYSKDLIDSINQYNGNTNYISNFLAPIKKNSILNIKLQGFDITSEKFIFELDFHY